ncbi:unnamed protein product [Sphagnum jensenii]|uniref:Transposase n=1 Tax=Sphagnum jensenii TaxID=128206 RepID=A0ABP1ALJ9_9BRYO
MRATSASVVSHLSRLSFVITRGRWLTSYKRKYGLLVTEQDGARVKAARCKFCKYFGRTVPIHNRKRKACTTDQFYSEPFRADLMKKHVEGQHANKWGEYNALSSSEQDVFFENLQPRANTMFCYVDMERDEINLVMSTKIVDVIIGDMMFRPEDELNALEDDDVAGIGDCNRKIEKLRRGAFQLFKLKEGGDGYVVKIKTVMRFKLAIQNVAATLEHTKSTCNMAKLSGISDTLVRQYMRVLVGHALQVMSDILASFDVWAFALSFDGSQHRGTTFFDVRARVAVNGVLYNLHLITMPHFDRHTTANQEAMLVKLLDVMYEFWTRKLIGVTIDGERTNMGHQNGVQVRMVRCALFNVVQIWCGPHQLDLGVKEVVDEVDGGTWVKTSYTLSTYLQKQSNLITKMGETCPKKTNCWLALGSVLRFCIARAPRITTFLDERRQQAGNADPPFLTSRWWLMTYAIALIISIMNEMVVKLQAHDLLICQQRQLLKLLADDIRDMLAVRDVDDEFDNLPFVDYVRRDNNFVLLTKLREYVDDLGTRAKQHWLAIDANEQMIVLQTIGRFAIGILNRIATVEAERDPTNNAADNLEPPVMPKDLVAMRSAKFISDVIEPRKEHLHATAWTDDQINAIESEHRELLTTYRRDGGISSIIDDQDHTTTFNGAWDAFRDSRFHQLRCFCAGLATVFPNSTSIESDFSILKWELDEFRKCLLDVSLEGIF